MLESSQFFTKYQDQIWFIWTGFKIIPNGGIMNMKIAFPKISKMSCSPTQIFKNKNKVEISSLAGKGTLPESNQGNNKLLKLFHTFLLMEIEDLLDSND